MSARIQGFLLAGAASLLAAGCGAGVAAVVASGGESSGGNTPTLTRFEVLNPKVSPATLRLEASAGLVAELSFQAPGIREKGMTTLSGPGVRGDRVELPRGTVDLTWDFAAELGGSEFVEGVTLFVRHPGGTVIDGGTLDLGLGNDAPVIEGVFPPTAESDGVVPVGVRVSDTSSDVISVRVQWRRRDEPADEWKPASAPEVLPGEDPNPLENVQVGKDGTFLVFFWDTDRDLADDESDVLMLFIPDDGTRDADDMPIGEGVPVQSLLFHIDNNEEPIVTIDTGFLITNPDNRRGIPIPYRVQDDEKDPVRVVFQWRRSDASFPALPDEPDAIEAILLDPQERRDLQICSEFPVYATGPVIPVDERTVRLPDLGAAESWIVDYGLEGRQLELLRPSATPEPISDAWRTNPLQRPVSVLPTEDGLHAFVLDGRNETVRLRKLDLASGLVVREIAAFGPGEATGMAIECGGGAILIASDQGGSWRLDRVDLSSGATTKVLVEDGSMAGGSIRGIASLGTNAAAITLGSTLLYVDYRDLQNVLGSVLLGDLAEPWGIAVDPLDPGTIYLAERVGNDGKGRILRVILNSRQRLPVVVGLTHLEDDGFAHPESLAFERQGSRLLVVAENSGQPQLFAVDVNDRSGNEAFPIGPPMTSHPSGLASGPDGLRIVSFSDVDSLSIGGGVEQTRSIERYDFRTREVSVTVPFDPPVLRTRAWRIRADDETPLRSADGSPRRFVWDSREAAGVGTASLRALPIDSEVGLEFSTTAAKALAPPIARQFDVLELPGAQDVRSAAAADLDGDGDQDLFAADTSADALVILRQTDLGAFGDFPTVISIPGDCPYAASAADLDDDGDLDLVSSNLCSNDLTVSLQDSPGSFVPGVRALSVPGGIHSPSNPVAVTAADIDGDGDQDLVSANSGSSTLAIFLHEAGAFAAPARLLNVESGSPQGVAVADLDGDGDVDLLCSDSISRRIHAFFQTSQATFSPASVIGDDVDSLSAGAWDVDCDGDCDIVSAGDAGVAVYYQTGPGNFGSPLLVDSPFFDGDVVAFADMNHDGLGDIVSRSISGLVIFFQASNGSFDSQITLGDLFTSRDLTSLSIADVDGDSYHDLITSTSTGFLVALQRPGQSITPAPLVLDGSSPVDAPFSFAARDMDSDGLLDLVSVNVGTGIEIIHQTAARAFDPSTLVLPEALTSRSVAIADIDGDGDQDIVAGGGGTILLFRQAEAGFGPGPFRLGEGHLSLSSKSIAIGDLDRDGDLDIASPRGGQEASTAIFFQESPWTFGSDDISTSDTASTVEAADVDGDGTEELVLVGPGLTVLSRQESGNFVPTQFLSPGGVFALDVGDVDNDGYADIVTAALDQGPLVFFQERTGQFRATPLLLPAVGRFGSVVVDDLDADGDEDIAGANIGDFNGVGSNLLVFPQRTPREFEPAPIILDTSVGFAFCLAAPDLDGDGDKDLVTSSVASSSLVVFWGGR